MKLFKVNFRILFILIFFPSVNLLAQDEYIDDAALWVSINLEKKINKHLYIQLNQQNRINENISSFGRGSIDLGVTWRFSDQVRFTVDYAYLKRANPDNSFTNEHRFYSALLLKKNYRRFDLSYRGMVQMRMKNIYSSPDGKVPRYYLRNKIMLKYDLNKYLKPFVSEELFYPFYQAKSKGYSKSRSAIGLEYRINRHTQLEFYFLYQQQLNSFNPTNRDYVYGVTFSHEL